jgi:hypothetical protein
VADTLAAWLVEDTRVVDLALVLDSVGLLVVRVVHVLEGVGTRRWGWGRVMVV